MLLVVWLYCAVQELKPKKKKEENRILLIMCYREYIMPLPENICTARNKFPSFKIVNMYILKSSLFSHLDSTQNLRDRRYRKGDYARRRIHLFSTFQHCALVI